MAQSTSPFARERLPLRAVLISMVALWATYFVIATIRSALIGLEFSFEVIATRLMVTAFGIVVTIGLWRILRLVDTRPMWVNIAVILFAAAPCAVLIAHFNVQAFAPINERIAQEEAKIQAEKLKESGESDEGEASLVNEPDEARKWKDMRAAEYWLYVSDIALGRYFLILSWAAVYLAMQAGAQARAAERREGEFRQAARDAELRSLRYQVNPHFLFNTLNSLSALILTDKNERAEEMVQSIASFYRQSLTGDPTADLTVADEFALQEHYLAIEAVRFPERLKVKYDLPDDLVDACIPGMILQPLVENSVKYAVAATTDPVTITLRAREEFGRLVLTVSDDGPGGEVASSEHANGHGIGLENVRRRLEARFGKDVTVVSGPNEAGYSTIIRIPLVYHGNC